jgi:hypothetical protein
MTQPSDETCKWREWTHIRGFWYPGCGAEAVDGERPQAGSICPYCGNPIEVKEET